MKDDRLEIICSPHTGFCFGVKRAMKLIEDGLSTPGLRIYSIGDVIHNPQAVERLKSLGVTPAASMEELSEGDTLVIRAHGVDPDIRAEAIRRGIRLIDTTCPFVRKSQEYVEEMIAGSRQVIIIGDPRHPEVTGIAGRAGGTAIIIETLEDADGVSGIERAGVVIQTTFSREKAMEMVEDLKKKIGDI
ncbi:MAG TPA: hypothetical protein VLA34_00585, partial [Candidatus Krumholzibacterium sp.]|nr:hypothetical protein [Candidatus Krumholzibacterium sp.]